MIKQGNIMVFKVVSLQVLHDGPERYVIVKALVYVTERSK